MHRWWSFLLVLLALCETSLAQSYDFGFNIEALTRRQDEDTSPIVVGRLPFAPNGSVPLRPEIRQMQADQYKWDLFILALSMFQSVSQDDPLSWYQIAGIHGVPFQPWNNVQAAAGAGQSGYCMHSSVLFPLWHRPYVALVEQETFRLVNLIASMFPNSTERQLYQQAASDFRWPYWDWSAKAPDGQPQFPSVFWGPIIDQYGPEGTQAIQNPLYSYQFHPLDENAMIWPPLKYWHETKRGPDTNVSLTDPPSQNDEVNQAMQLVLPDLQERLFIIFSSYSNWNEFSNKAWAVVQNDSNLDSIEAIHDTVHIYGGSGGHMTYVPLSSFDALFFMHHAMVDRLVAMWQVLNPSSWISPMANEETSFNAPEGTLQYSGSPLTPFLISSDGTFWDPDMARSTEVFGYAYADTYSTTLNSYQLQQSLSQKVATWYGQTSTLSLQTDPRKTRDARDQVEDAQMSAKTSTTFKPNVRFDAPEPPASAVIRGDRWVEWIANMRVNAGSLGKAFHVVFFIGNPPDDRRQYTAAQNRIGSMDVVSPSWKKKQSIVTTTLPLTRALRKLVASGHLPNLDAGVVEPFLKSTLQFRVTGVDNQIVHTSELEELAIWVNSADVRAPKGTQKLPRWDAEVVRFQVRPASGGDVGSVE